MSYLRKRARLVDIFGVEKPIIGMVHLLPLPGSGLYDGNLEPVLDRAIRDARALEEGGVDAIEVENFGDMTYFPGKVEPETVAAMTYIASELSHEVSIPIGICVLTDPYSAFAIAHVVGASFIRATVYTEAIVDVSGIIQGPAHRIQRLKKLLSDDRVKIFADVQIKHSVPLAPRPIEESAKDAFYFLADAVIVSGRFTGEETPVEKIKRVKEYLPEFPILVGSGANPKNIRKLLQYADGAIVGTTFKRDRITTNPVDVKNVKEFMEIVKSIRRELESRG